MSLSTYCHYVKLEGHCSEGSGFAIGPLVIRAKAGTARPHVVSVGATEQDVTS